MNQTPEAYVQLIISKYLKGHLNLPTLIERLSYVDLMIAKGEW